MTGIQKNINYFCHIEILRLNERITNKPNLEERKEKTICFFHEEKKKIGIKKNIEIYKK